MKKRLMCATLACALAVCMPASAMTRDELRAMYSSVPKIDSSPYAVLPDTQSFTTVGAITNEAVTRALAYVNFLRAVAGLDPVEYDELYALRAQNACVLLAANDTITHTPDIAEGMPQELYLSAREGAAMCNLACLNWSRDDVLTDGIEYFIRDDGDMNLFSLSHRRWLLNPYMGATGFGLARSESGMTYVAMYATDMGNAEAQWDYVLWPSEGAFPVELMRAELSWSIILNDDLYDIDASDIRIYLTEAQSGAEFCFHPTEAGDDVCRLDRSAYGSGVCVAFHPDLSDAGIDEYVQNQIWTVRVTGLQTTDGQDGSFAYTAEMASVHVQDVVSIELSQLDAHMCPGDTLKLLADVIPAYADDMSVTWESSDESVATVDANGCVTAVCAGKCRVTAQSANGRYDFCEITVED